MKTFWKLMIVAVLFFAPVCAFSAELGYMRLSLIEGDVQIKTPDAGDWGLASINGPLTEGDQVWAPQGSRAELQLNNGTYIRLDGGSALQILSMDKDSSQLYLSQGRAYVYYDARRGSVVQIDTPDASVRAFNRAIFRLDMGDQYTDVAVYKGFVKTENDAGEARINAGEMLSLGQSTNGEVSPMGPADDWENWNSERNRYVTARRDGGSRYLPAELQTYSADFNENGRWVQVPGYGYCWTPTVAVGVNWAPYRHGRWIWRGGEYVWVGFEPWGWAPYHYGRWTFVANSGWCWVPPAAGDVYWSPGYVGWVKTPEYVAWVPLAPGEVYYGRGYYGRQSVNITNVNVTQVNITNVNVYKNVNINNGVTVINRNSFNTASPTIVNVNKNIIQQKIFVRNNISMGAPAIKPTRASYFASARPVPAAKLPPQPVRNVRMEELKHSRPLVKEAGKSVLNPGVKIQPLQVNTVKQPRTPGKERPRLQNIPPVSKGGRGALGGPGPREEIPKIRTIDKGKTIVPPGQPPQGGKKQFQPEGNRPIAVPGGPGPRETIPKVQTIDRGKGGVPAGQPPQGERKQFQPAGNWPIAVPGGPGPRETIPKVQTIDRGKGGVPAAQPLPVERRQLQPTGNRPFTVPGGPATRELNPQIQTIDRGRMGVPAGQPPQGERKQFQPAGNRPFTAPGAPATGVNPQVQAPEKGKGGPPVKGAKPQIQPAEKGEQGKGGGPGAKGEAKPAEPVEGNKKVQ